MKFIYTGQLPIKDVDLTLAGILKPNESIYNGTVFEVPDENKSLIQRVKLSGVYEPYVEPKKNIGKPKSKKKEEEKKVEEEK